MWCVRRGVGSMYVAELDIVLAGDDGNAVRREEKENQTAVREEEYRVQTSQSHSDCFGPALWENNPEQPTPLQKKAHQVIHTHTHTHSHARTHQLLQYSTSPENVKLRTHIPRPVRTHTRNIHLQTTTGNTRTNTNNTK